MKFMDALFVIFEKAAKFEIDIGGALRVNNALSPNEQHLRYVHG